MDTEKFTRENLVKKFNGNKYILVNVAAQRARQINDGVEAYVRAKSKHPLEVAFQEIEEGFVGYNLGARPAEDEAEVLDDELIVFDEMLSLEPALDLEEEAIDIDMMEIDEDEVLDTDEIIMDEEE
ncbi:MAG: DNA-directed RNA polymerase subunit omega [bacterium]